MNSTNQSQYIEKMRQYFNEIDTNHNGKIEASELSVALNRSSFHFSENVIKRMIAIVDNQKNGCVTFEEFAELTQYLENQRFSFAREDSDKNGKIDHIELGRALLDMGYNLKANQIKHLLAVVDEDHNGTIEFAEFIDLSFYLRILEKLFSKLAQNGKLKVSDLVALFTDAGLQCTSDTLRTHIHERNHLTFDDVLDIASALKSL